MVKVETSVLINQPIEKVFEFVTKPENDAKWYVGLESWDHTPEEPAGEGMGSMMERHCCATGSGLARWMLKR